MKKNNSLPLLGGLSTSHFMRYYWQRKPLLIRQAFNDFNSPISIAEIKQLARQDDVESRLISKSKLSWKLKQGPVLRLPSLKQPDWTILVQGVDLHHDATADLMQHFRFIPDARLDDIMVSLASPGGGVGAHVDSYDVFLLQGYGKRRWRISSQSDLSLDEQAPIRILKKFLPEEEGCVRIFVCVGWFKSLKHRYFKSFLIFIFK